MLKSKPAIQFLIYTGALLGLLVFLFSLPRTQKLLSEKGVFFYSLDLSDSAKIKTPIAQIIERTEDRTSDSANTGQNTLEGKPRYAVSLKVPKSSRTSVPDSLQPLYDSLITSIRYLSYSDAGNGSLGNFFNLLSQTNSYGKLKQLLKIWYYGDSQIEGDRITREIRRILQKEFGGYGFGYVPLSNPATYMHLELGKQDDFQKLSCFQHRRKHRDFGVSGLAFKPKAEEYNRQWLNLHVNILKWLPYRQLELKMAMDNTLQVEWKQEKDSLWKIAGTSRWNHLTRIFNIGDTTLRGKVSIRVKGSNPIAYGFNFEGSSYGVIINNYGIRGHSGDGLRSISNELISNEAKFDNLGLVVFHYGNNMVPYIKNDEKTKKWVQGIFRGLFTKYKLTCPSSSFLVIGPGSMGKKEGDEEMEYEACAVLNQWMKEVSQEQGMAYFDFYRFMSDAGGVLKWREKGLASLDGHLSFGGQKRFATNLTESLLNAFKAFELTTEKK